MNETGTDKKITDVNRYSKNKVKKEKFWYDKEFIYYQKELVQSKSSKWYSRQITNFILGEECPWSVVLSDENHAVRRDIIDDIKKLINEGNRIITLTGEGGEGKTIILMQLFTELVKEGKKVLYHIPSYNYELPKDIDPNGYVLIVDDPANTVLFKNLLKKYLDTGFTLVLASRKYEWNIIKNSVYGDLKDNAAELETGNVTKSESERFAEFMYNNIKYNTLSKSELADIFYNNEYGFMYSSVVMIRNYIYSLEKIADKDIYRFLEYENGKEAVMILAAISFAEKNNVRINISYKELYETFSLYSNSMIMKLKKHIVFNGSVYHTRNKKISTILYEKLFDDFNSHRVSSYLSFEEQKEVILKLMNVNLKKIRNSSKKLDKTNPYSIEISNLFLQALYWMKSEEEQQQLINELVSSCQKNGLSIINNIYTRLKNFILKKSIVEKCIDMELPIYTVYYSWIININNNSDEIKAVNDKLTELCIKKQNDYSFQKLLLTIKVQTGNIGDYQEENSARWIARNMYEKYREFPGFLDQWLSIEVKQGNIGDYNSEYSARWLAREIVSKHPEHKYAWEKWLIMEVYLGNIGDYETENTARWIAREAVKNCIDSQNIWQIWVSIEREAGNIGDYETENTARWIAKESVKNNPDCSALWVKWISFEKKYGEIGDYETENTAKWIVKKATETLPNSWAIWEIWTSIESINNIGDYDTAYSERWIIKESKKYNENIPALWEKWITIETECGNIGDYETENTARWIVRNAIEKVPYSPLVWAKWISLETESGNIGNYETENTARWIAKKAVENYCSSPIVWCNWILAEEKEGNIGDYNTEYTARWLIKKAVESCPNSPEVYKTQVDLETKYGVTGDYTKKYSVRWLLKNSVEIFPKRIDFWREWICFEKANGNIGNYNTEYTARWIAKKATETNNYSAKLWKQWYDLEKSLGNIGDCNTEYSAIWIEKQSKMNCFDKNHFTESLIEINDEYNESKDTHSEVNGNKSGFLYKITGVIKNIFTKQLEDE